MRRTVGLRCLCGGVRGLAIEVAKDTVNRATCYCDDCQTFAAFLGTEGVTDEWGGTDIVQVGPARLRIVDGVEEIRCARLSPKGLFRFYTGCCRTPIGNSLPGVPFVGIPRAFIELPDEDLEATFGPSHGIFGKFAGPGLPSGRANPKIAAGDLLRVVIRFVGWTLAAASPSPYFGAEKRPIVTPEILTKEQREGLRATTPSARR